MRIQYILPAIMLFSLAACEKKIKVDLPEHQSALVINSYTETGDSFQVQLGRSVDIQKFKSGIDLNVSNATVVLYTNGVVTGTMQYDAVTGMYIGAAVAEPGKSYSVKASAEGFNTAEASTDVPSFVAISSVKKFENARLNIDGQQQDEIRIQFTDPVSKGDYYIVRLSAPEFTLNDTAMQRYDFGCVNTADPSVESIYDESIDQNTCLSGEGIFLRDELFNGSTKELRVFVNSGALMPTITINGDTTYPGIGLYHVPEAYFRYLKSYRFATENIGNPFAEPTNVYTNVKNGYGIFSVVSYDYKDIR